MEDDALELIVEDPEGEAIYAGNNFSNVSLGIYEDDLNFGLLGYHTQNVYFPRNGSSPNGEYTYFVDLTQQNGTALDAWTLEVRDKGETVAVRTGSGSSEFFSFLKIPDVAGLVEGGQTCKIQPDILCCATPDCPLEGDVCVSFRCITEALPGTPRFTLSWAGGKCLVSEHCYLLSDLASL